MIKSKKLLAIGVIAALGLAACGSDDDSASESTDAATEGTEAATEGTEAPQAGGASFVTLEDESASYDGLQAPDGFRVNLVTDIGKVDDGTYRVVGRKDGSNPALYEFVQLAAGGQQSITLTFQPGDANKLANLEVVG